MTIVHSANARQALASCGHVFISVLRQPIDMDDVVALRAAAVKLAERTGNKSVSLAVIEPGAASSPASADVRDALSAFAKESFVTAAAIVIEGSGFKAAATRTIVAAMYLVSRSSYPHKIFATPAEGAAWLVEQLLAAGVKQSVAEIVDAVDKARAALR